MPLYDKSTGQADTHKAVGDNMHGKTAQELPLPELHILLLPAMKMSY